MAITPKAAPRPKRRKTKRRKQVSPALTLKAENIFLHLQGKLEELSYSNHPDAPKQLFKVQRLVNRCRRLIRPDVATQLEFARA